MTSFASLKDLNINFQEKAKKEELQQSLTVDSNLVQEQPATSIAGSRELTEL